MSHGKVSVAAAQPGDTVVVTTERALSPREVDEIRDLWGRLFGDEIKLVLFPEASAAEVRREPTGYRVKANERSAPVTFRPDQVEVIYTE
jgi:hypothetical protein